jgi:hypothetical protein
LITLTGPNLSLALRGSLRPLLSHSHDLTFSLTSRRPAQATPMIVLRGGGQPSSSILTVISMMFDELQGPFLRHFDGPIKASVEGCR